MIGRGHLDVKVAVPCDAAGRPVNDTAIFHESLLQNPWSAGFSYPRQRQRTVSGWDAAFVG